MTTPRTRRSYDHRIREMICETGDPALFPELKIPRSTIRSWLHRGIPDVVTCELLSAEKTELLAALKEPRYRAAALGAIVGLARRPASAAVAVMVAVKGRGALRSRVWMDHRARGLPMGSRSLGAGGAQETHGRQRVSRSREAQAVTAARLCRGTPDWARRVTQDRPFLV
jgi:hypothetical protein